MSRRMLRVVLGLVILGVVVWRVRRS